MKLERKISKIIVLILLFQLMTILFAADAVTKMKEEILSGKPTKEKIEFLRFDKIQQIC